MSPYVTTILTGVFSVVVAVITSSWFSKKMMKDDRIEALSEDIKDIVERQKSIESVLSEWQKCDVNLTEANVALLKERFEYLADKALEKGTVTMGELNALTRLSVPYFKLDDKDGTGHNLLERVKQLPLEKSHEKGEVA